MEENKKNAKVRITPRLIFHNNNFDALLSEYVNIFKIVWDHQNKITIRVVVSVSM